MKSFIKGISYYVPEKKLTNDDLALLFPERNADTILQRTGIKYRGISEGNEISSDLALKAAEIFFKEYPDVLKSDIDFLIFCTQGPDYFTPTTACLLQDRIGLEKSIGAFDLNHGCSGFIYGLSLAKGLIETSQAKNILLLNCEVISKIIHPRNRASRTLFGDAATAVLISSGEKEGIGNFVFGTNGKGAEMMMMKGGGKRFPLKSLELNEYKDENGNISSDEFFYMNGPEVFSFSMEVVPKLVNDLLQLSSMKKDDIDYFVFHQANLYVLDTLRKMLAIPSEKFCINLSETGNTVSCTIPIALKDSMKKGKIQKGSKVMLVAFGVGLSWGASVITI